LLVSKKLCGSFTHSYLYCLNARQQMSEKLKLRCITKDRRPSSQQVNRWIRFVIDSKDCPTNAQTRFNNFCRVFDETYRLKENLSNDEESQPKKKKRKLNESPPLSDLIIVRHFGRAPEGKY
jgi:hypothetical protein